MLVEAFLLSGGATYWLANKPKFSSLRRKILLATDQGKPDSQQLQQPLEMPGTVSTADNTFSLRRLLHDIHQAIGANGRDTLKMDIDPELKAAREAEKRTTIRKIGLSTGAVGLAVLGASYPLFALAGAVAVLYLSRESFYLVRKDFQRGHYLSTHLVGLAIKLGMIMTGHLVLAALMGLVGGIYVKIINRIEEDSQNQLISVFVGHPEQVWLLKDGAEVQVDFSTLQVGDQVIVNAGEVIPVDGLVVQGEGQVDQHLLTGESRPVEKQVGDKAFAATLLLSGRVTVRMEIAGQASVAASIGNALNQTQNYKDELISRGRKTADRFIPMTLGMSTITLPLLGPASAIAMLWSNLGGAMAPLGSLSVLNYLQLLSRYNILVKDGRVFESLRQIDTVVFDKTGTLTLEQPAIKQIHILGEYDADSVLRYAAAAEYRQSHPVAKAIIAHAQQAQLDLPGIGDANYEVGYGIKVQVEGCMVQVGSARFMQREDIKLPEAAKHIQQQAETESHSLVYVAINGQMAGMLEMHPTIRPEAKQIVDFLRQRDIDIYIISGDHEEPTRKIAQALGIGRYFAEVLPQHKAKHVEKLKAEGRFVCFVGDGINDAIALKTAQVSISLKGASTAATDTAQVIFMDSTLNRLTKLFQLVDEFEETMRKNLVISFIPGIITIGGIYLLNLGIAASMLICYLGGFIGLTNIFWPLVKHQNCTQLGEGELEAQRHR